MKRILALVWLCLAAVAQLQAASVEVTCTYGDGRVEKRTNQLEQAGAILRFRWKADEIPSGVKYIELRPEFATAQTGEEGYFVMPNGFLGTFRERNGEQALGGNCMPMFGMKTPRAAFVAIVTGLPLSYTLVARAKEGMYTLFPRFQLGGEQASRRSRDRVSPADGFGGRLLRDGAGLPALPTGPQGVRAAQRAHQEPT